MLCKRCLLGFMAIFLLSVEATCQDSATITRRFTAVPFQQFVQHIESVTPYRFYFRPAELDSLRITAMPENQSVTSLLNQVFQNTAFRYAVDSANNIYVVKLPVMIASMPDDFFDRSKPFVASANTVLP